MAKISPTQLKILQQASRGERIACNRGRTFSMWVGKDKVNPNSVWRLVACGYLADVEPEATRWRASKYAITEDGKAYLKAN